MVKTMDKNSIDYARAALMTDMLQQGYLSFEVDDKAGGQFTLSQDIAMLLILDHEENKVRLGFPPELKPIIEGSYAYWSCRGNYLVLQGVVEGSVFGFEILIPLSQSLAENLSNSIFPIHLGILLLSETQETFDIQVQQVVRRKGDTK